MHYQPPFTMRSATMIYIAFLLIATHMVVAVQANQANNNGGGSGSGWFGNFLGSSSNTNADKVGNEGTNKDIIPPPPYNIQAGGGQQPPPPPILEQDGSNEGEGVDPSNNSNKQQQQQQPPPPPFNMPPWGTNNANEGSSTGSSNMPLPPPPPGFNSMHNQPPMPPPQHQGQQGYSDDWHMHQMLVTQPSNQQQQQQQQQSQTDETIHSLQSDIDSLLSHQTSLYNTIQNLTTTIQDNDQMLQFQVNQIDILLEQVADAESYARSESNAALEYKRNCTDLGNTISSLQIRIEELELKCTNLEDSERCHLEDIDKLKDRVKKKERELEKMACGIEMARLEQQKEKYKVKLEEKKRKKKNRGLVSWLFDCMFGSGSRIDEDGTDEELEKLRDLARSTLLHALQSERNNVHELEAALSTTQQNNSAISEMVISRDSLIDELNDRVSVFEEDKMVLKAALKQLQKEMKDEAPRTQKLIEDLETAKEEISDLDDIIEELKANHTDEIAALEEIIEEKNDMINETDSKMSMISVYVDQLEERLASFAVARRDINLREDVCKNIEEEQEKISEQCEKLGMEKKELTKARDELKALVDLMAQERSKLQDEKDQLVKERDASALQAESLRDELRILNENFVSLDMQNKQTISSLEQASAEIAGKDADLDKLQEMHDASNSKLQEQIESLQKSTLFSMSLQEEIGSLKHEKEDMSAKIAELETTVNQIREEAAEKFANQVMIEAEKLAEEKIQQFRESVEVIDDEEVAIISPEEDVSKEPEEKQIDEENVTASEVSSVIDDDDDDDELVATFIAKDEIEYEEEHIEIEIVPTEQSDDVFSESPEITINGSEECGKDGMNNSDNNDDDLPQNPSSSLSSEECEEAEEVNEVEEINKIDDDEEEEDGNFQPPPPPPSISTDDIIEIDEAEDSGYPLHPPPPPPPSEIVEESESIQEEKSIEINVSNDNLDELPPSPQSLTEEEVNIEPQIKGESGIAENQYDMYGYQQQTLSQDKYYADADADAGLDENYYHPPPPPPPVDQINHDTFEHGDQVSSSQYYSSNSMDPTDQFQSNVYKEQSPSKVEVDVNDYDGNASTNEEENQEVQDKCLSSDHNIEEDDSLQTNVEESTEFNKESIEAEIDDTTTANEDTLDEGNGDQDDFEIISDDEEERPAGYFEDDVDYEEKFAKFQESSDDREGEKEEPVPDQPSVEEDQPELPGDDEEGIFENMNSGEDHSSDKSITSDKNESINGSNKKRKVPLRRLRKTFAFLTGVHGAFTPSTKQLKKKNS